MKVSVYSGMIRTFDGYWRNINDRNRNKLKRIDPEEEIQKADLPSQKNTKTAVS